ncbi:MAG: GNAT family N-acetyltransferase [Candidatus Nephthysia bennettiae]|nr:MAG: GNAT family N-acetyltransferase [Candidatus Dormibacteraeota bacterium]
MSPARRDHYLCRRTKGGAQLDCAGCDRSLNADANGVGYPGQYDVDVVLRDGSTVHLRPALSADLEGLTRFLSGLSEESKVFRFFHAVKETAHLAASSLDLDYQNRFSLIALHGEPEVIVGHGFYAVTGPARAEVAFAVADELQGHGLGTILLGQLAQAAVAAGIAVFEADVMSENYRMAQVFRESGFEVSVRSSRGVLRIEFPTELTDEARSRFEHREQLGAVAALKRFMEPSSVAVIGASRRRGTIGGEVFHNLMQSGFPGPVYPVSPHPVVQSVSAYPDVRTVPGPVDLGVVVVPAEQVCGVAEACAEKGVGALVVISAGFAEVGGAGQERQADLLEICRRSGMRLVGPNCMGILNTDPDHRLDATFGPVFPPAGRVGFMSQSGALGLAVMDQARRIGLGLSSFASVGNKADVSGNDLLEYWETDPSTDVVMLYLESFGNPRRFSRVARRVSRSKPILAVKSGRSAVGARATSSHTGAVLAASDATVDALFDQSGVIRADTLGELFDVASLLATQPAPSGRRVGKARQMAEMQAAAGLEVTGFLVQQMVPKGVEMIVGVVQDPVFGPVVACGAGGTAVELMKDLSVRLPPLTGADAERMLSGLVSFPLLEGYRGGSRVDMAALKGLLLQVSALAEELPEVVELDLNPVVATSSGVVTVDARLRIEGRDPQRPEGSLLRAVR